MSTSSAPAPITLAISGMTCAGCASTVTRVLSRVAGVVSAQVDLAQGRATVEGSVAPEALVRAVEGAGFGASLAAGG